MVLVEELTECEVCGTLPNKCIMTINVFLVVILEKVLADL